MYVMTLVSVGERDGGSIIKMAAEPDTTVQDI